MKIGRVIRSARRLLRIPAPGGLLLALLALSSLQAAQYRETEDDSASSRLQAAQDYSSEDQERGDPISIRHYAIDAELVPQTHTLKAKARIEFQALQDVSSVQFELNSNLFPKTITGANGQALSAQRGSDDNTLRITLGKTVPKDQSSVITMEFAGELANADYSPVEGVQLAYIGEEGSYLLYPARWFPMSGYSTNRYTADLQITVPAGITVVSGGKATAPTAVDGGRVRYSFSFAQPQFPGSIVAVPYQPTVVTAEGLTMKVYFAADRQSMAQAYGEAAAKIAGFFAGKWGPPPNADLSIVEIDDHSLGGYAGPEMVFLSSRGIGSQVNQQLLAQEVAQQWWRGLVSPATRADSWLDHGLAEYSEMLYQEHNSGAGSLNDRIRQVSVDALTYDTVPIRAAGRLADFSMQFKSVVYDKAAVVLNMLRWEVGDDAFFRGLKDLADRFAFKSATTDDFRKVMEQESSQNLKPFFLQWFESTGASDFKLNYIVYRTSDGFKVVGKVEQDMDVFSMPVEIKVETDGDPVTQRVLVSGRDSEFSLSTFGRPRKVIVDPNDRVLKYNDTIRLRVAIARGEQAADQRDYSRALDEYQKALDLKRTSSLAHYRVGEAFYQLRNYQSAANAFRESLNGDLDPKWTEVWSHLYLGKIFDVTGQRDRAMNEYQQALRTKDDTQGALQEANKYLKAPFERTTQQAESSR